MSNQLKNTTNPYLLQHAENPVNWYPWCEEAFEKAKSEDKSIFLSIGYSTCHWCHVMAYESFEDEKTAENLNKYFVSIKVNREERPDIDSVYMSFTGFYRVKNEYRPIRIIAMRKSKEAEKTAVRNMQKTYSRKQKGIPKNDTQELNKYIILATSLDYFEEKILELYRTRWQIEIVFHRLKSLFHIGNVPSKKSETVKTWFYGKLFLAVLCEAILKTEAFSPKEEKENQKK